MTKTKGILLCGGSASRLKPISSGTSKHLLPLYDKPVFYYPLSILMLSNIREILLISSPEYIGSYQKILGDGSKLGLMIEYQIQPEPNGIGGVFNLAADFIQKSRVALILGDNIFYGNNFSEKLLKASKKRSGATIFSINVNNPEKFGNICFEGDSISKIIEKPSKPKSKAIVTGLYYYDERVVEMSRELSPSKRGEYEITDINNQYLKNSQLNVEYLGRGFNWFDIGNPSTLLDASNFIKFVQSNQKKYVACLEEIAFQKKWISKKSLKLLSLEYANSEYGNYLLNLTK